MNAEQRDNAKKLYFQSDLTISDIADTLKIPRRTVHYWIREHNWDIQKENAAHMPAFIAENCYHVIARYIEQLLSAERADTLITHKEADTLYKLTMVLGKLKGRISLNENMQVIGSFMDNIEKLSPAMADCVQPFADQFIADSAALTSKSRKAQPVHAASPVVSETEEQLDREDIIAWQQEQISEHTTEGPVASSADHIEEMRRKSNFRAPSNAVTSQQPRPSYEQFIADLRKQDDNLKHIFPINNRNGHIRAA